MLKLLYALTAAAFLGLLAFCCTPSHADGWQDKLGAVAVAAPNSGAALGAGVSYQANENLFADLFAKRANGGTRGAVGLSTPLQSTAQFAGKLLGVRVPRVPAEAAIGAAIDTHGDKFFYAAYHKPF